MFLFFMHGADIHALFIFDKGLGIDIVVIPETPRDSPIDQLVPPEIIDKPKDLQITEGETAKFSIKVKNFETAAARWMKEGKPLIQSRGVSTYQDSDTFTLEIKNADINDEALYECYVSNDAGEVRCEMELLVDGMLYWFLFILEKIFFQLCEIFTWSENY